MYRLSSQFSFIICIDRCIIFAILFQVLILTNGEILTELQSKYPGLYNVSAKSKHKLLEDLAKVNACLSKLILYRGKVCYFQKTS